MPSQRCEKGEGNQEAALLSCRPARDGICQASVVPGALALGKETLPPSSQIPKNLLQLILVEQTCPLPAGETAQGPWLAPNGVSVPVGRFCPSSAVLVAGCLSLLTYKYHSSGADL